MAQTLKLKALLGKITEHLSLYTAQSSTLSYHNGKMTFWRSRGIVVFRLNGIFSSLPAGGYTSLGTIPVGFRPANGEQFYRQQAGLGNYTGIMMKLTSDGAISVYNYTGSVWNGNGYFTGAYACTEDISGDIAIQDAPAAMSTYVIEQGTASVTNSTTGTTTWTYRKWSDGVSECWGKVNTPSKTYSANSGYQGYTWNYPSGLFIETPPCLEVSGGITTVVQTDIGFTANDNATRGQSYLINRNASAVTNTGWFFVHCLGKWK